MKPVRNRRSTMDYTINGTKILETLKSVITDNTQSEQARAAAVSALKYYQQQMAEYVGSDEDRVLAKLVTEAQIYMLWSFPEDEKVVSVKGEDGVERLEIQIVRKTNETPDPTPVSSVAPIPTAIPLPVLPPGDE